MKYKAKLIITSEMVVDMKDYPNCLDEDDLRVELVSVGKMETGEFLSNGGTLSVELTPVEEIFEPDLEPA